MTNSGTQTKMISIIVLLKIVIKEAIIKKISIRIIKIRMKIQTQLTIKLMKTIKREQEIKERVIIVQVAAIKKEEVKSTFQYNIVLGDHTKAILCSQNKPQNPAYLMFKLRVLNTLLQLKSSQFAIQLLQFNMEVLHLCSLEILCFKCLKLPPLNGITHQRKINGQPLYSFSWWETWLYPKSHKAELLKFFAMISQFFLRFSQIECLAQMKQQTLYQICENYERNFSYI
ncbi:hypothetical protein TTHERM_000543619 (macronuclear) [Tetrahymena thermophila SB210]|uniref:Uncharacterized protein n=1 Tax=Tetrahymena thermophila (strain SB210) TaxID=312017 RepID=W7XLR4_TETTS|nr:hypothetical protein TTHERM_000543619 [Tetrahymena thermophila SB210]EWS76744.1 hypothetical protein TTHERM_000543619 [Tetrahymena thermophila SB210]|eukprot:XP_012650737.1 hypothetical protein TTHERM_000543619 [Tetrahymena thermophila SB210]